MVRRGNRGCDAGLTARRNAMADGEPANEAEAKRRMILRVARRHFMAEGFAGTGMEAVARDAGISTATLYAHFPGKRDLFSCMLDDAAHEFSRRLAPVRAFGGPARERITSFAVAYARFMSDPCVRAVYRLVAAERRRFGEAADSFHQRGRLELADALIKALAALDAEGQLRVEQPAWAAGQLLGMIEHPAFLAPLVGGDAALTRTPEDIAGEAVETFMARFGA